MKFTWLNQHTTKLSMWQHRAGIGDVCACSVVSDSLATPGTVARQDPLWDSPNKNTGVDCHFLLQGIFSTQGSNPHLLHLLHWQVGSLPLEPLGKSQELGIRPLKFTIPTLKEQKPEFYALSHKPWSLWL